jgi:hypothetical protein
MRSAILLSVSVLAASIVPCSAQEVSPAPSSASPQDVTKLIVAACPRVVSQMFQRPELGVILKERPIDTDAVCACTETSFRSDQRLQKEFLVDQASLARKMTSEHLRSYLTMRLMHSVLTCLLPEMAQTLDASDPAK